MKRILATLSAAILLSLATSAQAQAPGGLMGRYTWTTVVAQGPNPAKFAQIDLDRSNYTDAWWVPSESGWGVSILQLGNSMALMFYVFDETQKPVWYRGVATNVSNPSLFQGDILSDSGTPYNQPGFGPIPGAPEVVGTVSLRPLTLYDAELKYTIKGATLTKQLTRLGFSSERLDGDFSAVITSRMSGCAKNGDLMGTVEANATQEGSNLRLSLAAPGIIGGSCVISGNLNQLGRLGKVSNASYVCSDNSSGTVNIDGWEVSNGSFTALISGNNAGCVETGRLVGSKH